MRYFVYLEFCDVAVAGLLRSLRDALMGSEQLEPVHVTVRGPYSKPPDKEHLDQLRAQLRGQVALVADVGHFRTRKGYAVYLHAQSAVFKTLWWKPDFQGPNHRMIPHVTVFETHDRDHADLVEAFLRSERIEIKTAHLDLSVFISKQQRFECLFNPLQDQARPILPMECISTLPGLLERASTLGQQLKANAPANQAEFQFALV